MILINCQSHSQGYLHWSWSQWLYFLPWFHCWYWGASSLYLCCNLTVPMRTLLRLSVPRVWFWGRKARWFISLTLRLSYSSYKTWWEKGNNSSSLVSVWLQAMRWVRKIHRRTPVLGQSTGLQTTEVWEGMHSTLHMVIFYSYVPRFLCSPLERSTNRARVSHLPLSEAK